MHSDVEPHVNQRDGNLLVQSIVSAMLKGGGGVEVTKSEFPHDSKFHMRMSNICGGGDLR